MKSILTKFLALALGLFWCLAGFAAEVMPPKPTQYFNDYAGVVSPGTTAQLNAKLEQFERDAYNQIVVAVFPKMQSDSSIEDYTVRVAKSWQVGQKDKNNGAVLFVFVQDHKMFLQVGYGLEGAIPDAICKRIIADEITPHFKAQDVDGGLTAGVNAIMAASKGEYHGTGRTVADKNGRAVNGSHSILTIIVIIIFVLIILRGGGGGLLSAAGWMLSSGGGNWSGGRSSGGGGGFSSGGGNFGGGGAGGSW